MKLDSLEITLNKPIETDTFYGKGVGVMSVSMTVDGKKNEVLSVVDMDCIEKTYPSVLRFIDASIKRILIK